MVLAAHISTIGNCINLNIVQLAVFYLVGASVLINVHRMVSLRSGRGLSLRADRVADTLMVWHRCLLLLVGSRKWSLLGLKHHILLVAHEIRLTWVVRVTHLLLHHARHLTGVRRRATQWLARRRTRHGGLEAALSASVARLRTVPVLWRIIFKFHHLFFIILTKIIRMERLLWFETSIQQRWLFS